MSVVSDLMRAKLCVQEPGWAMMMSVPGYGYVLICASANVLWKCVGLRQAVGTNWMHVSRSNWGRMPNMYAAVMERLTVYRLTQNAGCARKTEGVEEVLLEWWLQKSKADAWAQRGLPNRDERSVDDEGRGSMMLMGWWSGT